METNVFTKATVFDLAKQVVYAPGGIVSKQLLKNDSGNITLFSFDKEQGLSEHTAPFDAFVQILDGEVAVYIDGTLHKLTAGEIIVMPANVPHALHATERFKMLLTMIKG